LTSTVGGTTVVVVEPEAEETPDLDSLGGRLRFARKRRDLSSRELARRAGLKSQTHPGLIEGGRGGDRVSLDIVASIARALDVPLDWLANGGALPDDLIEPPTKSETPDAKGAA
jgi:transcriptional regulator with XRE-family HTH domain